MEKKNGHEAQGRQKILMGRNSTTYPKGNGPGYGGPAKGARRGIGRVGFTSETQPQPDAKKAGHEIAADIRARIAAQKDKILGAQIKRATDISHPAGHAAAVDLLNRIAPPESKQTIAGDPDAPLGFTIVTGVPRAED